MTVLGVFGAGVMGGNHVRTARALREWSEVYVGDVDSDKAREVARRNGFRARDLAKADLDAAIVAVPSDLHEEVVLPLLDRGVHVLLEKPVAQELGSAQRILDAARDSESRVVVGHVERFNSAVSELLKWAPKAQHVEFRRVGPAGGRIRIPIGVQAQPVDPVDPDLHHQPAQGQRRPSTNIQAGIETDRETGAKPR